AVKLSPPARVASAFLGPGAYLYALHRCAQALRAPELAAEARARAESLPVEDLGRNAPLDLAGGVTGLLLGFTTPAPLLLAQRALETHRTHGRWFPTRRSADRHELSALWGLPALAHLFLRAHDPDRFSPLVDLLP